MQPFLAMIVPMGGGGAIGGGGPVDPGYSPPWARPQPPRPDNTLPGGQGGYPSHPIYYPPYPDQGLPPFPSHPIAPGGGGGGQPVYPSHPIYYPPYPDQGLPPFPSQGLPGSQPRPDQGLPPFPSHPIYIPPAGAQPPLGIWGPTDPRPGYGLPGPQPHPEHPIVLPPDLPPTIPPEGGEGPDRKVEWKTAWTPTTGWIIVGIPAEGTLVPTPSSKF